MLVAVTVFLLSYTQQEGAFLGCKSSSVYNMLFSFH